jgi:hypothetical protein
MGNNSLKLSNTLCDSLREHYDNNDRVPDKDTLINMAKKIKANYNFDNNYYTDMEIDESGYLYTLAYSFVFRLSKYAMNTNSEKESNIKKLFDTIIIDFKNVNNIDNINKQIDYSLYEDLTDKDNDIIKNIQDEYVKNTPIIMGSSEEEKINTNQVNKNQNQSQYNQSQYNQSQSNQVQNDKSLLVEYNEVSIKIHFNNKIQQLQYFTYITQLDNYIDLLIEYINILTLQY